MGYNIDNNKDVRDDSALYNVYLDYLNGYYSYSKQKIRQIHKKLYGL